MKDGPLSQNIPVSGGDVCEMRLRLTGSDTPRIATVALDFLDAGGRPVDARLAHCDPGEPQVNPLHVEVLPPLSKETAATAFAEEKYKAAATATRYIIVPPEAVSLSVHVADSQIAIAELDLRPMAVDWVRLSGQFVTSATAEGQSRGRLVEALWGSISETAPDVLAHVQDGALGQITAIASQYAPQGDWSGALDRIADSDPASERETRIKRLARARELARKICVGFIGSRRTFDRLRCLCDVYFIREDIYAAQIDAIRPEVIIIETTAQSGPGDWDHAFHSVEGALPKTGTHLIDAARAHGALVHVLAGCAPNAAFGWRDTFAAADRVIVEGAAADWSDVAPAVLPPHTYFVVRATEPAVAPAAVSYARDMNLTLVPCGSDIMQYPDFAAFLSANHCHDTLIADYHYGFVAKALRPRLGKAKAHLCDTLSDTLKGALMQNATIVLLPGQSLRSDQDMMDLAMDAVAAGAIPVIYGDTDIGGDLFDRLDRVRTPLELQQLQRLFRSPWRHERRWRALYRLVSEKHRWTAEDRKTLLGRDPCEADFDAPRMSVTMISNRPHLITHCIDTFRAQSWDNKELILVLNMDEAPDDLPSLRPNERIFTVPEHFNIGRCLNMAIEAATGRYWVKMDDDDFYSATYLEENARYYHDTQADVIGRQAVFFYFDGPGVTRQRQHLQNRCRRIYTENGHSPGAALSGDKTSAHPMFSNHLRNSADSEWVRSLTPAKCLFACYDFSSLVVFRDRDEAKHTWQITGLTRGLEDDAEIQTGNIFDLLEHDDTVAGYRATAMGAE